MKTKLNKILLIDDSEADNYIHSRVIKKADVTEEIIIKYGAAEALEYLNTKEGEDYPNPDLIFLDINMPGMNGWDFLEEYKKLGKERRKGVVVCMLSTSALEVEQENIEKYNIIESYSQKPLTKEALEHIIQRVHPEKI
ncbi:response regulator [Bernardetia sp.]|uniref:response regulator n=1 Tax=Bernardetia sp. TaxID=1937974 RepID=UPI0025BACCBF|nr:response regulator [Bernardetia sp.]